jgi:hypothetical protein
VRHLLRGDEGISLREVGRHIDDDLERLLPDAYIDVGTMLKEPRDIVIEVAGIDGDKPEDIEKVLRGILGNGYTTHMKPSPMVGRINAMKQQLDRGEDTMDRKLRYLLWLN